MPGRGSTCVRCAAEQQDDRVRHSVYALSLEARISHAAYSELVQMLDMTDGAWLPLLPPICYGVSVQAAAAGRVLLSSDLQAVAICRPATWETSCERWRSGWRPRPVSRHPWRSHRQRWGHACMPFTSPF